MSSVNAFKNHVLLLKIKLLLLSRKDLRLTKGQL